jgi:hypothetical protein
LITNSPSSIKRAQHPFRGSYYFVLTLLQVECTTLLDNLFGYFYIIISLSTIILSFLLHFNTHNLISMSTIKRDSYIDYFRREWNVVTPAVVPAKFTSIKRAQHLFRGSYYFHVNLQTADFCQYRFYCKLLVIVMISASNIFWKLKLLT